MWSPAASTASPDLICQSAIMSVLNLSDPEIGTAYKAVLSGDPSINWVVLSYSGVSDLKVQATGSDGLDELKDEFSDGRYGHLPSNPPYPYPIHGVP